MSNSKAVSEQRSAQAKPARTGPYRFVGRGPELARLCEAIEAALRGRGAGIWVVGGSGVGKTALLGEVERYAIWRGMRVVRAAKAPGASDPPTLWLCDPVASSERPRLARALARCVETSGAVGLATARSRAGLRALGVEEAAICELAELDSGDAACVLLEAVGSAMTHGQADAVARAVGGNPRALRAAAARWSLARPSVARPRPGCGV